MKFKKMKGIVLGIVLFTMSSLTVTAAPMVQAPFTAGCLYMKYRRHYVRLPSWLISQKQPWPAFLPITWKVWNPLK